MTTRSIHWHPTAASEILNYAKGGRARAKEAGQIYTFVSGVARRSRINLPTLRNTKPPIHWWDIGQASVYMRVESTRLTVLHIATTVTSGQRTKANRAARAR